MQCYEFCHTVWVSDSVGFQKFNKLGPGIVNLYDYREINLPDPSCKHLRSHPMYSSPTTPKPPTPWAHRELASCLHMMIFPHLLCHPATNTNLTLPNTNSIQLSKYFLLDMFYLMRRATLERKKHFRSQFHESNRTTNLCRVFYKSHKNVELSVYIFGI